MTKAPIGIFDSGVGGLTVARAVMDQLPNESVIYVGDTAHSPYGSQSLQHVRRHALAVMDDLVDQGVKMLVIACNTASSAALRDARERYWHGMGIPVVEVIQPAVRRAVRVSNTGRIGLIATKATIESGAYEESFTAAVDLTLTTQACPRFVEFVEAGVTAGPEVLAVTKQYLQPLIDAKVDTLVLGCTHYPLLSSVISYVMGAHVTLVSSAEEAAKDVYRVLRERGLLQKDLQFVPVHRFLATGDPAEFENLAHRFLGPEVGEVERV